MMIQIQNTPMIPTGDDTYRLPTVVELRDVSKKYGAITALHALDLDIHAGAITAILGPNGRGKAQLST